MPEIIWKGNIHTNSSARVDGRGRSYIPSVIVNHISEGTASSVDYWFTDPDNKLSSAHFLVTRTGEIHQYLEIERMAWSNGLDMQNCLDHDHVTAQVIFDMKVNPNLYTVSIEHEGYAGNGLDGSLTEPQFQASVWLHKYIRNYVRDKMGQDLPLDESHVFGHCDINKVTRPNCPGPNFPWARLYVAIAKEQQPVKEFSDIGGHWAAAAIKAVASLGIVEGFDDGTFRPDQTMTRAEVIQVINNLVWYMEHR